MSDQESEQEVEDDVSNDESDVDEGGGRGDRTNDDLLDSGSDGGLNRQLSDMLSDDRFLHSSEFSHLTTLRGRPVVTTLENVLKDQARASQSQHGNNANGVVLEDFRVVRIITCTSMCSDWLRSYHISVHPPPRIRYAVREQAPARVAH